MQRTAVLYAVALATLVGAFFLVIPKMDPPAPPPTPTPTPAPSGEAITQLTFGNHLLRVDARLDRGKLLRGTTGEPVWMDLTIKAADRANRAHLTTVLVIDRSGSMAGEKIDNARMAAERLVRRLGDGDKLAIVTYGTDVAVDLPLTHITASSKRQAIRVIQGIEEGGGTNINGALRAAHRLVKDGTGHRVGRVVLVSDGRATEGERRTERLATHADAFRKLGVAVSTIGVGLDYHEDLMETLAVRGLGRYHYLRRASLMGKILDDEFKHASQVVARDVQVTMLGNLGYFRVAAAPGQAFSTTGGKAHIQLGDLAAGEVRHLLVRLDVETALAGDSFSLPAPAVQYEAVGNANSSTFVHQTDAFRLIAADSVEEVENSRRADVQARVLQLRSSLELTQAMHKYSSRNVSEAINTLEANARALKSLADKTKDTQLAEEAQNLDRVLNRMRKSKPSSSAGADLVKEQKARAYQLRR